MARPSSSYLPFLSQSPDPPLPRRRSLASTPFPKSQHRFLRLLRPPHNSTTGRETPLALASSSPPQAMCFKRASGAYLCEFCYSRVSVPRKHRVVIVKPTASTPRTSVKGRPSCLLFLIACCLVFYRYKNNVLKV